MRSEGCPCYWLERNGRARLGLRRFTFSEISCPASSRGHDASQTTEIEFDAVYDDDADGRTTLGLAPAELVPPHRSRLWPPRCEACGGPLPRDAEWQAYQAIGYVRSDTGETVWTRHARGPEFAGALVDESWWLASWPFENAIGDDGIGLVAVCPNGAEWRVDGPASGGGRWTRQGDPRSPETLTVSPSIVADDYHGFLQAGRFTAHIG